MKRLDSILAHAKMHCGYYRDFKVANGGLEAFPIINRSILRENFKAFLTAPKALSIPIAEALEGEGINAVHRGKTEFECVKGVFIEQTSGSSGIPLRIAKTGSERSELSFAAWCWRAKFDPSIKSNSFLPLFHRSLDSVLPVSPYVTTAAGISAFYDWLKLNRIRWLHAPPKLIAYHASLLKTIGFEFPIETLRFIEVSGSRLEDSDFKIIEGVMDVQVINQYGSRESWAIGYSAGQDDFEINDLAVHVELIGEKGEIIYEPDEEGYVVVTSKVLRLLPLIRYKTGDRGHWVKSPETPSRYRLRLSEDRELNMLMFKGRLISGNILFKDVLHTIDHKIGYGYARFIQIRKISETTWKLLLYNCSSPPAIYEELSRFLVEYDSRAKVEMVMINEVESQRLFEQKPYLFVNESRSGIKK